MRTQATDTESSMTLHDVRRVITRRALDAGSMLALSRELGVCNSTLHNIMIGRKGVGPRVLAALGLQAVAVVHADSAPVAPASTYEPMWRLGDWPVFRRGAR